MLTDTTSEQLMSNSNETKPPSYTLQSQKPKYQPGVQHIPLPNQAISSIPSASQQPLTVSMPNSLDRSFQQTNQHLIPVSLHSHNSLFQYSPAKSYSGSLLIRNKYFTYL